jgi:hypothetical protein
MLGIFSFNVRFNQRGVIFLSVLILLLVLVVKTGFRLLRLFFKVRISTKGS